MTSSITSIDHSAPPFPSLASLRAAHRDLLDRRRLSKREEGFLANVELFVQRVQATGMLLDSDNERWASQSLLDYWSNTLYRAGHELPDVVLDEFDPTQAPQLNNSECPYRGLDSFQEQHHQLFCGRKSLIDAFLDRLRSSRLLAIVGASGSGKSSLALAGLLPALKAGGLPGSQGWHYHPPMVPGSNPLENLARAICPPQMSATEWLSRTEKLLHRPDFLARAIELRFRERPTVLVVDQFEEIFTLCTDSAVRQLFIDNLLDLINRPGTRHSVILTMRSHHETRIAQVEQLQLAFQPARAQVTPLSASELREAIEEPAKQVGLIIDESVVTALIQDILGEPAGLPLLQFTLLKLWEHRERRWVTWNAYQRLGGGRRALELSAEQFYEQLLNEHKHIVRQILLRMARLEDSLEVTNNRVRRSELRHINASKGRIDLVLDKLIVARLVRETKGDVPDDTQIELAHEALVRNWPRLVQWLEEERASIRERRRLTIAAEQWEAAGHKPEMLWRGSLLLAARSYADLSNLEGQFVDESQQAEQHAEQEKYAAQMREIEQAHQLAAEQAKRVAAERERRALLIIALLFAVAAAALIFGIVQQRAAQSSQQFGAEQKQTAVVAKQTADTAFSIAQLAKQTAAAAAATARAAQGSDAASQSTRTAAEAEERSANATAVSAQALGNASQAQRATAETQSAAAQAVAQTAMADQTNAQTAFQNEQAHRIEAEAQLGALQSSFADLQNQLSQTQAQRDTAIKDRDAAIKDRDAAVQARDLAIDARLAAEKERDAAIADRNAAIVARDAAIKDRDAAAQARDQAIAARQEAEKARDAAINDRDAAAQARDQAIAARQEAEKDRDAAIKDRDAANADRDAAIAARDTAIKERDAALQALANKK